MFPEIGWVKLYPSPGRSVEYVSEYIFLVKKKTKKAKESKEENILSVKNLTGYDDTVCEFALCTFNLLDRVVTFT